MESKRSILNLPNQITIARLIIAVLLFVFLSLEIAGWGIGVTRHTALNLAMVVFIICVGTDWLDGWIARRTQQETVFGRLADPFVDKVVVCGTFIYLVRLTPELIKPWFPVALIGREFLVSGLRGYIESQGIPFGARWGGKIKMVLQSITIPAVLFYQGNLAEVESTFADVFHWFCLLIIPLTLIATLLSAWDYVSIAIKALRMERTGAKEAAAEDPKKDAGSDA